MDALTHLTLPLLVLFVLYRERFHSPEILVIGGFGLLSDGDKFLGMPGMLHSLLTLVPICIVILTIEYAHRERLYWSPLIVALVGSHLILDFVDGGPVPLLFPLIETGVGLRYPAQTVFGEGPFGLAIEGALFTLRTIAPRPGFNTYGFIKGAGVASTLALLLVYWQLPRSGGNGTLNTQNADRESTTSRPHRRRD